MGQAKAHVEEPALATSMRNGNISLMRLNSKHDIVLEMADEEVRKR